MCKYENKNYIVCRGKALAIKPKCLLTKTITNP